MSLIERMREDVQAAFAPLRVAPRPAARTTKGGRGAADGSSAITTMITAGSRLEHIEIRQQDVPLVAIDSLCSLAPRLHTLMVNWADCTVDEFLCAAHQCASSLHTIPAFCSYEPTDAPIAAVAGAPPRR